MCFKQATAQKPSDDEIVIIWIESRSVNQMIQDSKDFIWFNSWFNHLVGKPESIQLAIQATLKYTIPINSWFNENSIDSIQISESSRNRLQVWS